MKEWDWQMQCHHHKTSVEAMRLSKPGMIFQSFPELEQEVQALIPPHQGQTECRPLWKERMTFRNVVQCGPIAEDSPSFHNTPSSYGSKSVIPVGGCGWYMTPLYTSYYLVP